MVFRTFAFQKNLSAAFFAINAEAVMVTGNDTQRANVVFSNIFMTGNAKSVKIAQKTTVIDLNAVSFRESFIIVSVACVRCQRISDCTNLNILLSLILCAT